MEQRSVKSNPALQKPYDATNRVFNKVYTGVQQQGGYTGVQQQGMADAKYIKSSNDMQRYCDRPEEQRDITWFLDDRKEMWDIVEATTESQVGLWDTVTATKSELATLREDLKKLNEKNKQLCEENSDLKQLITALMKRMNIQQPIADPTDAICIGAFRCR